MLNKPLEEGLTFDDVLLTPSRSEVLPAQTDIRTNFSRNIQLNVPIVSAAMDTVTESELAIAVAQQGGIGIIHKNMTIAEQADEVDKVKRSESGMIVNPITMSPDELISDALNLMEKYKISGVPITRDGKLVGILTNRDLRFETNFKQKISQVMTKENLITVPVGIGLEEAKKILHRHKIEKLLVVDDDYKLKGLITVKDIKKGIEFPNACKDEFGRLRVGGAIGPTPDMMDRAAALVNANVDVLVIDTAHGHTKNVLEAVAAVKKQYPQLDVVAGNIASAEAARDLIEHGVDAIKVGMGPGSICTTRVVTGAGVPQITAIDNCYKISREYGIPLIADGGIKYSGDVAKAVAAGASSVMIGSLFAGTDESPGEQVLYQGRYYKVYRGMGSIESMKRGSKDRYAQSTEEASKMVPEGIEGRVPYRGNVSTIIHQLVGGLRAGMGYCGCKNLDEMRTKTKFMRITAAGLKEGHVHDVIITKEAPNYQVD
ncbi:IMP dehydrogenase [bacterium]|nr:IMP dehydrogenase [bacterium]MCI0605085.1 IMP dehydrogenase [bacterium]